MKLHVTNEAAKWYIKELDITPPSQIRLFPRYGGVGGIVPGFSLGINQDVPTTVYASIETEELLFFVEENDAWYFGEHDLTIQLDADKDEPEFIYE